MHDCLILFETPHAYTDLSPLALRNLAESAQLKTPPAIPGDPSLSFLDARGMQAAARTSHDLPQAKVLSH